MKGIESKAQEALSNTTDSWGSAPYRDVSASSSTRYHLRYKEHRGLLKSDEGEAKILSKLHSRYDLLRHQGRN
jgi:hypothetical protein